MKNRLLGMAALALAVTLVPGCAGLEKMKKNAAQIRYKVTPETPETHAGKVEMSVNGIFPGKYFDKKATLTATPVVKYNGGELALAPIILQGERVNNNYRIINYNAGGNFSYKGTFDYKDEMRLSDIMMTVKASKGKKSVDFEPVKIGQGILSTSTLMAVIPKPMIGVRREANNSGKYDPAIDPFQRIVPDEMLADINFLINSATLRKEEVQGSDVKGLVQYTSDANADKRKEIKKVEISAYASPDGSLDLNTDLASKREKVSTAFMEGELKKAQVEANLRTRYTPEDWEGFREMLENSDIQDKDLILRVLSMYTDPEVREREIKNLSNTFTRVADEILPRLRRAKMLTSINIIGKTDEEIIAIASNNPESLNQAELLYAASLSEDADTKLKIYNSFSRIFPNDWRGPNNAAAILIGQFKHSEAKVLAEKAEKLKTDEPIVKNNLGAIALVEGDIKKAEEYFGAASGSGKEVNYNLGLVSIKKGDYNRANQYFGDFADPNTALVKILSSNYNGALSDLEAFTRPNCYAKEYLKAIIGVRTGNESLFYESLKNAVTYNPALKEKAKSDLEFAKYFEAQKFREITR